MPNDSIVPGQREFAETRWSLVHAARDEAALTRASKALAELCRDYWYPLYAFVRRQGCTAHEAQDLTQDFFARLLEKDWLDGVDRNRGRFRSWLLAAMKHFLSNERDKQQALKRGGGVTLISIDDADAEQRYAHEPADTVSADQLYDRRWALTMLEQSLARVREACAREGKTALFDELKGTLSGGGASHAEIATRLGMSEGAVSVAIHRLRQRSRAALRSLIAETVDTHAEVEAEMQDLKAALRA